MAANLGVFIEDALQPGIRRAIEPSVFFGFFSVQDTPQFWLITPNFNPVDPDCSYDPCAFIGATPSAVAAMEFFADLEIPMVVLAP